MIQQRIPRVTHKHVWEVRTLKHLKMVELDDQGVGKGEGQRWGPVTCSPEAACIREGEGLRLQVHSLWP